MGTSGDDLSWNKAKRGGRISSNDRAKSEMKGGGVSVGNGATGTQGRGVVSGNTAGDGEGEDVFRQ
jgi:hypothetical protein